MSEYTEGPAIDSIPVNGTQDAAPKRRRGRPPADPNAPKRSYNKRTPKDLKEQIGASLVTLNLAFYAIPPTRNDALEAREIELLAEAIAQQCKISPQFRKYVVAALGATQGGQLVGVLAIITARRMARHSFILPPEMDDMMGNMIGSAQLVTTPDTVETKDAAQVLNEQHGTAAA